MQITVQDNILLGSDTVTLEVTVIQAETIQVELENQLVEQYSQVLAVITARD